MTFLPRLITIAFATFAATNAVVSLLALILWRFRSAAASPASRSANLLQLRLLPVASSLFSTFLFVWSFFRFEPRSGIEPLGFLLQSLAVSGFILIIATIARAARARWRTNRALNTWMASARRITLHNVPIPAYAIDVSFPVVAVVGVIRPKLVVARSVLTACGSDELALILAHECAHLERRDNARRALMASLPDALAWFTFSRRINDAWHDATEEAADDFAAGEDLGSRLHLADALLRVARIAASGEVCNLPGSAIYHGERLEHRVRRLLEPPVPGSNVGHSWRLGIALSIPVVGVSALPAIHEVVEIAVQYLP